MATKDTLEKALQLKEKFEAQHPGIEIRIVDESSERQIGRLVAEENGLEIVRDDSGIMVIAHVPQFAILEVRHCERCGNEILTAAIGEIAVVGNLCRACEAQRHKAHLHSLEASCEREAERIREADWRNDWEERGK